MSGMNMINDGSVVNCTFAGNSTPLSNGVAGLRTSGSEATIANCILWGNTNFEGAVEDAQLRGELSSTLTVTVSSTPISSFSRIRLS